VSQTVRVTTEPGYDVHVGTGVLADVAAAAGASVAVLVDERVQELHGAGLIGLEDAPRLVVPQGESTKSIGHLAEVLDFLVASGLDRRSCLVTLGGGVVGDLGGLAASLFKRGMNVVHAATTLLAQVDASVGGKTAINLSAGKNLAGTFHQPRAVFCDVALLATLSGDEWRSGLGEVTKTALIEGEELLGAVERAAPALAARDCAGISDIVAGCVAAKARVVSADPTERGLRRALNLGHTFAHGIEYAAGFGAIPHGVAVAHGLQLALRASTELGHLADSELPQRVDALLAALGLGDPPSYDPAAVLAAITHDKKGAVDAPELVLPVRAGEMALGVRVEMAFLQGLLEER